MLVLVLPASWVNWLSEQVLETILKFCKRVFMFWFVLIIHEKSASILASFMMFPLYLALFTLKWSWLLVFASGYKTLEDSSAGRMSFVVLPAWSLNAILSLWYSITICSEFEILSTPVNFRFFVFGSNSITASGGVVSIAKDIVFSCSLLPALSV